MTPSSSLNFPDLAEIQNIVAESDAVLRNLRITYGYYRLNRAMAAITGSQNITWCGYATWASKTAGIYIRQEEVPAFIDKWIDAATSRAGLTATLFAHALGIHSDRPGQAPAAGEFSLQEFARQILAAVGTAIGDGNRLVFGNIAPPFSTLLSLWTSGRGAITPQQKQQFLDTLQNEQLPAGYLFQAFSAMFDAAEAPGSAACAQAMCYANALVGCVEQTGVQPDIVASMRVPVGDLFLQDLEPYLYCRFSKLIAEALKDALRPLAEALEIEFDRLCTEWLMQLNLPDQSLHLGSDVPPMPDGQMYPAALSTLAAPQPLQVMTDLNALEALGSAAEDWTIYAQRMRYIAVMFRSRQQDALLWNAPFTDAQIDRINQGQVPDGPL